MTYEEFEKLAIVRYDGRDHGTCTHDFVDCTSPLKIAYERFYHKMLVGEWVICKECGVVRMVSSAMDVRQLLSVPIFNREEVERIGICVSCTREQCAHRIAKDGEVGIYSETQKQMVHYYLCHNFTQDGIDKMIVRRGNTCS